MDEDQAEECFGENLILKIPHHGSKNSSKLLEHINNFGFAATTSYSSSYLPEKSVMDSYKSINSNVSYTGKDTKQDYGIIQYNIKLTDKINELIELKHFGGADLY